MNDEYAGAQPPFVNVRDLSIWLAGYAVPPRYALDHIMDGDPANRFSTGVTASQLTEAWQYHIETLIDCGLLAGTEGASVCESTKPS